MKTICLRYWLAVAVVSLVLLVPQPLVAQVGIAVVPPADSDLKTSLQGPLQRRLEAEYPGSFEIGVEVFWEAHDGWVTPEVLEWWAHRVTKDDFEELSPDSAERMFEFISDQAPIFSRNRKKRICAVVGASRNLLGSRYGDLIDAHDIVIRVNRAPTDSFRSDVGEKTTHHVMWPRELEEWQYDREAYLLMTPIAASTGDVFDRIVSLLMDDLRWDLGSVRIIHPEFVKYLHENWTKEREHYPSTGFLAVMIALHVCDEVDVFGFGADSRGRWDRYYLDDPVELSNFHPAEFEARVLREMDEKGILNVFRGSRPDPGSRADVAIED